MFWLVFTSRPTSVLVTSDISTSTYTYTLKTKPKGGDKLYTKKQFKHIFTHFYKLAYIT